MSHKRVALRIWSLFALVVAIAGGSLFLTLAEHDREEAVSARREIDSQLDWLRMVSFNALHRNDYESLRQMLSGWAEKNTEVVAVKVMTRNGFEVVSATRPAAGETIAGEVSIAFGFDNEAKISLTLDLSQRLHVVDEVGRRIMFLFVLVAVLSGVVLHLWLQRLREADALRRRTAELDAAHARLSLLEARHRLILDSCAEGIFGYDLDGHCTFVNPAAQKLLGLSGPDALIGQSVHATIHHSHADGSHYAADDCPSLHVVASGTSAHVDTEVFWRPDGTAFPVDYQSVPLVSDGVIIGGLTTFSDISERRAAEVELRKLSATVTQSPIAVIITDLAGRIDYVNAAFERMSGFTAAEVLGRNPRILKSGATPPEVYADLWKQLKAGQSWQGEFCSRRRDGGERWERAHISPIKDAKGNVTHYLALKEDVTTEHTQADMIRYQAEFDGLTGIPNRVLTLSRIRQLINQAKRAGSRIGLLFIDLDDFKKINDSLGHEVGDELLIEAAARFRQVIRESDTVGRHGGDEFLIVLDAIDDTLAVERVARDVLARFSEPFHIADMDLVVTASVGVAIYPEDGEDASMLLRNADTAMYSAKESGRNAFSFFAPAMNRAASARLEMERHLHSALENGEFFLEFQPQIDTQCHRIVGAEALLRWQSPVLGRIGPTDFIPLAEQNGQIVAIGAWVIDEACRVARRWRDLGFDGLRVAVNVSPRQFKTSHEGMTIADIVEAALRRHELPAACLEVEVTEGLLIKNWDSTRPLLARLHALGVRISLDDFGTGYSSLAYLRSFPFDILKIDQGFIRDLLDDHDDRALVGAIQSMAGSLNMMVVAEGVETAEQLAILRLRGNPLVQGFLFARPMSAAAFETFVAAFARSGQAALAGY